MKHIKQITKQALDILIENGYINPGRMHGVTVTSRSKKSGSKKYYVKDKLAFTAWDILGYPTDDKDFVSWKNGQNT